MAQKTDLDMDTHTEEDIEAKRDEPVDCNPVVTADLQVTCSNAAAEKTAVDEPPKKATKEHQLPSKKEHHLKEERRRDFDATYDHNIAFQLEMAREIDRPQLLSQIKDIQSLIRSEKFHLLLRHTYLKLDQRSLDSYFFKQRRVENALTGIQQMQELDEQNEALIEERKSTESEVEQIKDVLSQYTRCKDILCKASPDKSQEAKALENEKETEEIPNSVEDDNEPPLLPFAPENLSDMMMVLTEQNMSLKEKDAKNDETLQALNQSIEEASAKATEAEEKVDLEILDLEKQVDALKTSTTKLQQEVDSQKTAEEGLMFDSLREMVSVAFSQCVDKPPENPLSTLEMLELIKGQTKTIPNKLESVPKKFVDEVMKNKKK